MAKYAGLVGYATQEEISPGVWEDVIIERRMRGDILRSVTQNQTSEVSVNDDVSINNRFSLIGDPFSKAHFQDMRYVKYLGRTYKVDSVELAHPRLIVEIGGIWNGPTYEKTTP
ncbi:TPA: hypothetical protein SIF56_004548 [Escherichia coli]|nr:hypothetical protein [Escherichia coli]